MVPEKSVALASKRGYPDGFLDVNTLEQLPVFSSILYSKWSRFDG